MSSMWYFTRDGKQRLGPFTFEQLRQLTATGQLTPSDMVLKKGSRKWMTAGSIQGLFPPVPPAEAGEEPASSRRTRERTFWLAFAIVGGLVLLPIPIVLLALLDADTMFKIGFWITIPLLVFAIVWEISQTISARGRHTICPKCKKKYARVEVGRKVIEKKKCYGLVKRSAASSSSGMAYGSGRTAHGDFVSMSAPIHMSGSTSWEERVPVIRTTYLLIYECKYCQARWDKTKVNEVEDFDINR